MGVSSEKNSGRFLVRAEEKTYGEEDSKKSGSEKTMVCSD